MAKPRLPFCSRGFFIPFSKQKLTFFAFLPYFLVLLLKRFGVYEFLLYFCMQ